PKEIHSPKTFVQLTRSAGAESVRIKRISSHGKTIVKFKLRTKQYLYTICVKDAKNVERLRQSLPPSAHPTHCVTVI
ncbi:ribosomal protein L38e, partial [Cantharellus anzutake]|uniref:ribosomal protein L38e n=1 Tax=Cantharellus anzutake TaxID=1750568 RepID=UPI001904BB48